MFGATNREKATTVINCLDTVCVELVMLHLPAKRWSYYEACAAIIAEFGSKAYVATKKDAFMRIKIKDDETIEEFADRFYYDAQILMGCALSYLWCQNRAQVRFGALPCPEYRHGSTLGEQMYYSGYNWDP